MEYVIRNNKTGNLATNMSTKKLFVFPNKESADEFAKTLTSISLSATYTIEPAENV